MWSCPLLALGSGRSCHSREGAESTTLPFGRPQIPPKRPAEGPHPPLRQHKPFPLRAPAPKAGRRPCPHSREGLRQGGKGCRAPPARLQHAPNPRPPRHAVPQHWGTQGCGGGAARTQLGGDSINTHVSQRIPAPRGAGRAPSTSPPGSVAAAPAPLEAAWPPLTLSPAGLAASGPGPPAPPALGGGSGGRQSAGARCGAALFLL